VEARGSASQLAGDVVRSLFFLGSSGIHSTPLGQRERLPPTTCRERIRVMCITFLLLDVH
jgi:hypothetical protein